MRQTTGTRRSPGEKIVKDIKRATRKHYSSEEKIRIVLDGLRGEDSIAELCRREGYIRVLRYHNTEPSVETLSICASKLGYYGARLAGSERQEHQIWAKRLSDLKTLCDGAIARQAEAVWRAPERMAVRAACPKWVLQAQKSALRFFAAKYLSFRGGCLCTPLPQPGVAHE